MKSTKARPVKASPDPAAAVPPENAPSAGELIRRTHRQAGEPIGAEEAAAIRRNAMPMGLILQAQHADVPLAPSARRLVIKERRGRTVIRIAGRAGADLKRLPLAAWVDAQERAWLTSGYVLTQRRLEAAVRGVAVRRAGAISLEMQVAAWLHEHGRPRHFRKLICLALDINVNTLKDVLKRLKLKRVPTT
jgi:hypothetical protein